jgi:hypothetical protein
MEVIAICAFTVLYAIWCATDDHRQIANHGHIDHREQWFIRAVVMSIACLLIGTLPMVVAMAFLFSAVFRFTLNYLRGLDWRYVSASNIYDSVFIWAARGNIHRAGIVAYITELVVVILPAC